MKSHDAQRAAGLFHGRERAFSATLERRVTEFFPGALANRKIQQI